MQGFEEITIGWGDKEYVIPADRQLMLVAKIEDALTGDSGKQALGVLFRPEGPPYSRLAMAYGAALRFAGADVTDDEIYLSMMSDLSTGDARKVQGTQAAIVALISVVSPPMGRVLATGIAKKKNPPKK